MALELKSFAEKWCHENYEPEPVDEADLKSVESVFKIWFPTDYREQVLAVGLPSPTLALSSAIVDRNLDLHDLSDLCSPKDIIAETDGWRKAGMPDHLLVIGGDCMGNKFCFDFREVSREPKSGASIYFWDHDFGDTVKVANSFSDWIRGYLGSWSDGITATDF